MTVRRAHLLMYDQNRHRRKKLRCITNLQIIIEEDLIFWFYLCGWQLTDDHDSGTSISEKITTPVVTCHG